jgi:dolichyl-diphosphooligosaccharide--protein glycosyltransferase
MMRLILLTGPVASSLVGVLIGYLVDWCLSQFADFIPSSDSNPKSTEEAATKKSTKKTNAASSSSTASKPSNSTSDDILWPIKKVLLELLAACTTVYDSSPVKVVRKLAAVAIAFGLAVAGPKYGREFWDYSHQMAEQLSSPSIMFHANLRDGTKVTVDDYRQAYWWLRDNTPDDARVMAWWDYGYQISGIANRTTIADGNTWNHEHIATLGRCLTAPEKDAHRIVRHLADYVLIWTGGGGDDLAKSPHMARIGNSVFNDICPGDPTCAQFGFYQGGTPTPMMEASLLFKLHSNMMRPGVTVDPDRFREVFRSQYGKVRIYQVLKVSKESKAWVADPANRICDAPGSWYCVGQYPPALDKLISRRKNFAQLEDFNRGGGSKEYQKEYMSRMNGEHTGAGEGPPAFKKKSASKSKKKAADKAPSPEPANEEEEEEEGPKIKRRSKKWAEQVKWENTDQTTLMYQLLEKNDLATLGQWLKSNPDVVHIRSADGRGPLWWANEFGRTDAISLFKKFKIRSDLVDGKGLSPKQV